MMDIAKNLVSCKLQGPPRMTWWPRHSQAMMKYLRLSFMENKEVLSGVQASISNMAVEWDTVVPVGTRKSLMGEHSFYKTALIDCARASDVKGVEMIGNALCTSVRDLAASLGAVVSEFPETRFLSLLEDSVIAWSSAVRKSMGDAILERSQRVEKTTLALAVFSAEWL